MSSHIRTIIAAGSGMFFGRLFHRVQGYKVQGFCFLAGCRGTRWCKKEWFLFRNTYKMKRSKWTKMVYPCFLERLEFYRKTFNEEEDNVVSPFKKKAERHGVVFRWGFLIKMKLHCFGKFQASPYTLVPFQY